VVAAGDDLLAVGRERHGVMIVGNSYATGGAALPRRRNSRTRSAFASSPRQSLRFLDPAFDDRDLLFRQRLALPSGGMRFVPWR